MHWILWLAGLSVLVYIVYKLYLYKEPDGYSIKVPMGNHSNQSVRLILLRHASRPTDKIQFFTSIDSTGEAQAKSVAQSLQKYPIDYVVSSPFLRTLQTVTPYLQETNQSVGIDYALYEYRRSPVFRKDPHVYTMNDVLDRTFSDRIDASYTSRVQPGDLVLKMDDFGKTILEQPKDLQKRVQIFLDSILNNPDFNNKTVLVVSHRSTLSMMRQLLEHPSRVVTQESLDREPFPFAHYVSYDISTNSSP